MLRMSKLTDYGTMVLAELATMPMWPWPVIAHAGIQYPFGLVEALSYSVPD